MQFTQYLHSHSLSLAYVSSAVCGAHEPKTNNKKTEHERNTYDDHDGGGRKKIYKQTVTQAATSSLTKRKWKWKKKRKEENEKYNVHWN